MTTASAFHNQGFIVLETFRKNGTPVATPVGFVQDGTTLYVRTTRDSGKVKRIRANNRVRVAPGTRGGQVLGDWFEARASILTEPEASEVGRKILAKYRFTWMLITSVDAVSNFLRRRPQPEWISLRIEISTSQ